MKADRASANRRWMLTLRAFFIICCVGAIFSGCAALMGWMVGSHALRSIGLPIAMNPLVAVLVIACGTALLLIPNEPGWGWQFLTAGFLSILAIAGGTSRLFAYLAGFHGGLDTLLFHSSLGDNQMAPNTAFCLIFLGASIILTLCPAKWARRSSSPVGLFAAAIAFVSLLGYFLSVLALYQIGPHIPMALNTAAALFALSVAVLLRQPEGTPTARFLRNWTLERTIVTGFVGALLMLCLVSIVSIQSTRALVSQNQLEGAAFDELLHLTDLVSRLKDAETGQRGYLLTGEEAYLEPYRAALSGLDADLKSLRQSSSQNPELQQRLTRIEPLIRFKLAELNETINLRRERGYDAALEVVRTDKGRRIMDEIRHVLAEMRNQGEDVVKARSADAAASARRTTITISVGCSVMVLVVIVAGLIVRRGVMARKAVERQLREADERYRLLITSVQEYAIIMLDATGLVVSWNAGAERIKGYKAEEIIGQHFSSFYPAEDQDKPARELEIATKTGRFEEEGWRVRKDGSRFWANVTVSAVRDEQGILRGFAKVTRDVTERKRNEDEIRKLNENLQSHAVRLEASNKELEAFSYSVSHDLRSPLRSIDGFSLALMEDHATNLEPEALDYLQRVRAATKRMAQLIDDLLALSRVSRSEMSKTRVDLSDVARAVAADLQRAQPDRRTQFEIADGLHVEGDPRLLRIVLDNLLGNAWKFTAKREGARIEFGAVGENGTRRFFIHDNGAGFDMAYAHKLFGAFQRLHANEEFAGTGIGLATVQRIINRHGGRISAEGVVGEGATFHFSL